MDRPVLAVQQGLQTAKLDSSVPQSHGPSLGDLVFKITDPRQRVLDAPRDPGALIYATPLRPSGLNVIMLKK